MNESFRQELIDQIKDFHLPRYEELPNVGLFLDQVVRYLNRYTSICCHNEITPSMISNYVKHDIVPRPNKKSYDERAIAYMFFVAFTKLVIPMDDITYLIDIQNKSYDLPRAYNYFCREFENLLQYSFGMKPEPDEVGTDQTMERELLKAALLATAHKIYMEQFIRLLKEKQGKEKQQVSMSEALDK